MCNLITREFRSQIDQAHLYKTTGNDNDGERQQQRYNRSKCSYLHHSNDRKCSPSKQRYSRPKCSYLSQQRWIETLLSYLIISYLSYLVLSYLISSYRILRSIILPVRERHGLAERRSRRERGDAEGPKRKRKGAKKARKQKKRKKKRRTGERDFIHSRWREKYAFMS